MEPGTHLAIMAFEKVCKAEKRLNVADVELSKSLRWISKEDQAEYFKITEQIRKRYDPEDGQ